MLSNVTSIDYFDGTLLVSAFGNNGSIQVSSSDGSYTVYKNINGFATDEIALNSSAVTTTKTTAIDVCSATDLLACSGGDWIILSVSIVFFATGAFLTLKSARQICRFRRIDKVK